MIIIEKAPSPLMSNEISFDEAREADKEEENHDIRNKGFEGTSFVEAD